VTCRWCAPGPGRAVKEFFALDCTKLRSSVSAKKRVLLSSSRNRIGDRDALHAAIGVMDDAVALRLAGLDCLVQCENGAADP